MRFADTILPWLAGALMLVSLWLIFMVVPNEASMGFVQRIVAPEDWPAAIEAATTTAAALDATSRAALYRVLSDDRTDSDLAELVRSAARPGLKARIARYLGAG